MDKIRVLVADGSPAFRNFLADSVNKFHNTEVVGAAATAAELREKITRLKPEVLVCAAELAPTERLISMPRIELYPMGAPPPINVAHIAKTERMTKPDMLRQNDANVFLFELARKIKLIAPPKGSFFATSGIFKQAPRPRKEYTQAPNSFIGKTQANSAPVDASLSRPNAARQKPKEYKSIYTNSLKLNNLVIAIGASTGGTEATLQVLKDLPADTPGIVIAQHMPPGFTKMYAERLDKICPMQVAEAKTGDKVERGKALIAPGNLQMYVAKSQGGYIVNCLPNEKVSGHRPSVDALFTSVAENACPNAVGIIMTGMGGDGANGLLKMRNRGAYTIGQDEASCVVYGMPMVAQNIGAVMIQASLDNIANVLKRYLQTI